MTPSSWSLKCITLSNILGFQGSKDFVFHNSLQVIEASNHTGKSSLAIALIWGLTGQLPAIDRISPVQFKLKHKLAGDNEKAWIEITLENNSGSQLIIRRSTKSSAKNSSVNVTLDSDYYEDQEAQEMITGQLGLKPQSLEGCCVVLQEQRLSLMTGDLKKSSETIHDILGLSTLSNLIPIIKNKLKDLKKLVETYEGVDPLKKWQERQTQLKQELEVKEQEAIEQGFNRQLCLTSEFAALYLALEISFPDGVLAPKEHIHTIQNAIKERRGQNPYQNAWLKLTDGLQKVASLIEKIERVKGVIQKSIEQGLVNASVEAISQQLRDVEDSILSAKQALDALHKQNGLFSQSLNVLRSQKETSCCPLCEQSISYEALLAKIQSNIEETSRSSIDQYESELKDLETKKNSCLSFQSEFLDLEQIGKRSLEDLVTVLETLEKSFREEIILFRQLKEGGFISQIEGIQGHLQALEGHTKQLQQEADVKLAETVKKIDQFESQLNPLEERLMKISIYLLPIQEIREKLVVHDQRKVEKANQSLEFRQLLDRAKKYAIDLEKFKDLMQVQEKEKANEVIKEHQDFVSRFFVKVANHPNYDTITITAKEMHGSVKYDFEASSSHNPFFADAARHVLSSGDLSCACMGLMLSLTRGKSNKAGFLVLDDPGECFDSVRMDRFAKEIQLLSGDRQTIILTHQADLAERLRKYGAATVNL